MHRVDTVRVLMYSHDTYGLGHLTRTVRIARAIRERHPQTSVLILSGSPVAPYFQLPPGADLVKLPSVVKSGPQEYRARELGIRFSQIKKLRRDLILGTAEAFRPHVFMVDNVPLGMKGEVLPTLRALHTMRPRPYLVLNLRDILDDPLVIREQWRRDGSGDLLHSHYDRIFVLGDRSVWDSVAAYGLPEDKTSHVGYAAPSPRHLPPGQRRGAGPARILLSAGGGGDGAEFLTAATEALAQLLRGWLRDRSAEVQVEVVTGPLMDHEERRSVARLCAGIRAGFHEFVPDLPRRMSGADLTIAMAGYNTCCEIFSHARSALVLPRTYPRMEQSIRARLLEERGILRSIDPTRLDATSVAAAIQEAIERPAGISAARLPAIDGLDRLAEMLGRESPWFRSPRETETDRADGRDRPIVEERRTRFLSSSLPVPSRRDLAPFWRRTAAIPPIPAIPRPRA